MYSFIYTIYLCLFSFFKLFMLNINLILVDVVGCICVLL